MSNPGSTLRQLREVEREARRNLIIDAAMTLFAQRPFSQVGMRDIAAEAGLSPASIYRYFADRDELFLEALFRESQSLEETLLALLEDEEELSLERIANTFLDYLLDHDSFFRMMSHFMIHGSLSGEAVEELNKTERKLLRVLEKMFRRLGFQANNTRVVSHAFFSSLNGVLITFRNYPGRETEDVRKHMRRLAAIISDAFGRLPK